MEARNLQEARSDYLSDVATAQEWFLIRQVKSKFLKTIHGTYYVPIQKTSQSQAIMKECTSETKI
jgi:hypothetical protein